MSYSFVLYVYKVQVIPDQTRNDPDDAKTKKNKKQKTKKSLMQTTFCAVYYSVTPLRVGGPSGYIMSICYNYVTNGCDIA